MPQPDLKRRKVWLAFAIGFILVALGAACLSRIPQPTRQIVIHADGRKHHLVVGQVVTVRQALAEAGIALGPLDRVSPPLASAVTSDPISVVRVTVEERTRHDPIPFSRLVTQDPRAPRGYRRIVQSGKMGVREIREEVILEDGVEVKRRKVSEQVVVEPVNEHVTLGSRDDPPLDAFLETALAYLGRGGVTRLSPAVVEQTLFELARLQGDRYGAVRSITRNGRLWLMLQTFAPKPDEAALLVFWWSDELHSLGQIAIEGAYVLDGRAEQTAEGIELGLIVSLGQGGEAPSPQYFLFRLPIDQFTRSLTDTWQLLWSSQGVAQWYSSQGMVTFAGSGLERLNVQGTSATVGDAQPVFVDCRGCPRRRFESVWERQGDSYRLAAQGIISSPYATLWSFVHSVRSQPITATLSLVTSRDVISAALKAGLNRHDLQWTVSGRETDTTFDLRSKESSVRVTLASNGRGWIVSGIGPIPGIGRILFTGTGPVVRGLHQMDPSEAAPIIALGNGQRYVWSPDYASVAYDWEGQVYIMASDGSNRRLIGGGVAPAWSPDGKFLALERSGSSGPLIIVVDLDSGQETTLVAGNRSSWQPGQGGGGQRLAYMYSDRPDVASAAYIIDVDSGMSTVLASDGREPLWSPDGNAVALQTAREEIAVITLTPGRVTTVGKGWGYTWSPDGRRLAFLNAKPAGMPMVWQRDSEEVKPLLERDDVDGLSWSPDGKELVLSLAGGGGLWLVESDGSNLRKLGDGRDPIWASSPRAGR